MADHSIHGHLRQGWRPTATTELAQQTGRPVRTRAKTLDPAPSPVAVSTFYTGSIPAYWASQEASKAERAKRAYTRELLAVINAMHFAS